ncbi:MAG: hypothetical protein AAF348_18765 [Bacteroidota bacterium]
MKKLLPILLFISCTKGETSTVVFQMAFSPDENLTEERATKCSVSAPVLMVLETDRGVFEFETESIENGIITKSKEMATGVYNVSSVTIYDLEMNPTHEVKEKGYSKFQVVFVPFKFEVDNDKKIGLQVYCK